MAMGLSWWIGVFDGNQDMLGLCVDVFILWKIEIFIADSKS